MTYRVDVPFKERKYIMDVTGIDISAFPREGGLMLLSSEQIEELIDELETAAIDYELGADTKADLYQSGTVSYYRSHAETLKYEIMEQWETQYEAAIK